MSNCPGCGAQIRSGRPTCPACGRLVRPHAGVPARCAACGAWNPPGSQFCQGCGVVIAPVAGIPAAQPTRVGDEPAPAVSQPTAARLLQIDGVSLPLPDGWSEVVIGRSAPGAFSQPELDLAPYAGPTSGISRRHARIRIVNGTVWLEDLHSTNFTYLNAQQLEPGQLYPLRTGDRLLFGQFLLVYQEQ